MEKGKKSFGRRKIPIQKIEKKANLQVTFSKRRMGLFNKASELSILCGAEIAIFIQSPGKKMFVFGEPSVDSVLDRFEGRAAAAANLSTAQSRAAERSRKALVEMERSLEREKEMEKKIKEMGPRPGFWWDGDIEDKNLEELQSFLESIEELKRNVDRRLEGMKVAHNPKLDDNVATAIPVVAAETAGTSRQGGAVEYPPPQLDWQNFDGGMMSVNNCFQSLLHDNIPVAVPFAPAAATAGPYHQGGVVGYPPQLNRQNFDGGVMMMMMDGSMQSSMLHENGNMGTSSLLDTAASEASVRDFLQNYFS